MKIDLESYMRDHYNGHVYELTFTEKAMQQYTSFSGKVKKQIDKGLERISKSPEKGKPLSGNLKGIWSERVSTYRILYKIYKTEVEVLILLIQHRSKVGLSPNDHLLRCSGLAARCGVLQRTPHSGQAGTP